MMVIAEVPEPGAGIGLGLKLTVVLEGWPEADKAIELLNPPLTVVVIVEPPWVPCCMVTDDGEAEIVKLGGTTTVRVTVVFCWMPPPLPVTVMG